MNEKNIEIWLRMYEEQVRHGRHHEALRSQATNMIIAVSAALLAFFSSSAVSSERQYVIGAFLIVVNVYGLIMSLKHYEGSRLHVTVAGKYRDVISASSPQSGKHINDARSDGKKKHSTRFSWVGGVRAYVMWSGLHLVFVLLGVLILLVDGITFG